MFQSVWQSTGGRQRLWQLLSCPMSDILDAPADSLNRRPGNSSGIWSVFRYDRDKGLLLASARIVVNCRCYAVRVVNPISVRVLPLGYGQVRYLPNLRKPPVGREREIVELRSLSVSYATNASNVPELQVNAGLILPPPERAHGATWRLDNPSQKRLLEGTLCSLLRSPAGHIGSAYEVSYIYKNPVAPQSFV